MAYRFGMIIEQTLGHVTHTRNLQAYLRAEPSIQPEWILPDPNKTGWVDQIPLIGSNWTVRAGAQVRQGLSRLTRQSAPQALFFHTQVMATLAQDWIDRYPSIVSLDATPNQYDQLGPYYQHARGNEWLERQKWRLNRDCFRKARKLVTWSEWAKQGLVDEYQVPPEKTTVISPGVDTKFWARSKDFKAEPGKMRILFVGGDLKRKGGDLLLETFRAIRAEQTSANGRSEIELHLVTRDALPPEPGVFVYRDIQPNSPELQRLYHTSHLFCLPTRGDCLPMVLSEAGAAGLPIITTRLAAIPEIVYDGQNGLLIPPNDGQELKAALKRLIDDTALRRLMGANGAQIVQKKHDSTQNASLLMDLLKEIADERPSQRGTP